MTRKASPPIDPVHLRQMAEERLAGRGEAKELEGAVDADLRRLLHELQVHQIELEMQNAELQEARDEIAVLLDGYSDLYDFAPMGYLSLDARGNILKSNLTASTLLGTDRSSLAGTAFTQWIQAESRVPFFRFIHARFGGVEDVASCDLACLQPPSRAAWIRMEAFGPVHDEECRVAFVDISERKKAEEERRRLEAELSQAQKLESLGSLAAGIAHDINNVLGAIYAVVEAQKQKPDADQSLLDALDLIIQAAQRGRALVGGLTAFARKDLPEPEPVDLNALVKEEVDLLRRVTLQLIEFDLDLAEPVPWVFGDRGRLKAALMNLCVNACDAMPSGGRITLRTHRIPGSQVVLTVEDRGLGMSPEVLSRAMDPFFTTKAFGKGTGLGLSTTFATAKAHGGHLQIESEPGKGTKVALRLPELRVAEASPVRECAPTGSGRSLSILFVDDDELIRASVPELLMSLGHRVESAGSGRGALAKFEETFRPDLVILDQNMPGLTGLETLSILRLSHPRLPVLFTSGSLEALEESALKKDPWVRVLSKPFSLEEIERAMASF